MDINILPITDDMRNNSQTEIDKITSSINNNINIARSEGRSYAFFDCSKYNPHYAEVRKAYESMGYRIVPRGYSCGVWQITERITW